MSYLMTPGVRLGPGTSLVERLTIAKPAGVGQYVGTPTYFGTPAGQLGIRGLGCGGSCGCSDCQHGMGLFDSGLDPSGWGAGEYAALAGVAWLLYSTVFTARRAGGEHRRKLGGKVSKVGKRIAR